MLKDYQKEVLEKFNKDIENSEFEVRHYDPDFENYRFLEISNIKPCLTYEIITTENNIIVSGGLGSYQFNLPYSEYTFKFLKDSFNDPEFLRDLCFKISSVTYSIQKPTKIFELDVKETAKNYKNRFQNWYSNKIYDLLLLSDSEEEVINILQKAVHNPDLALSYRIDKTLLWHIFLLSYASKKYYEWLK